MAGSEDKSQPSEVERSGKNLKVVNDVCATWTEKAIALLRKSQGGTIEGTRCGCVGGPCMNIGIQPLPLVPRIVHLLPGRQVYRFGCFTRNREPGQQVWLLNVIRTE